MNLLKEVMMRAPGAGDPDDRSRPAHAIVEVAGRDQLAFGSQPITAFVSRNSSNPYSPHSRPLPDCL
jgi:hypothetical protein